MQTEDFLRLDAIVNFGCKALALHETWEYGHGKRSAQLIENLALEMDIPTTDIVLLKCLAQIHDIGKIGIPDAILSRRRLSVADLDMIRGHPINGANLIKEMGFDQRIYLGILQHHEYWNGTGYPHGLKGMEISLWARMLLIVDTYDAICSERAAHKARTVKQALEIMEKESGIKSDPEMFRTFRRMME